MNRKLATVPQEHSPVLTRLTVLLKPFGHHSPRRYDEPADTVAESEQGKDDEAHTALDAVACGVAGACHLGLWRATA